AFVSFFVNSSLFAQVDTLPESVMRDSVSAVKVESAYLKIDLKKLDLEADLKKLLDKKENIEKKRNRKRKELQEKRLKRRSLLLKIEQFEKDSIALDSLKDIPNQLVELKKEDSIRTKLLDEINTIESAREKLLRNLASENKTLIESVEKGKGLEKRKKDLEERARDYGITIRNPKSTYTNQTKKSSPVVQVIDDLYIKNIYFNRPYSSVEHQKIIDNYKGGLLNKVNKYCKEYAEAWRLLGVLDKFDRIDKAQVTYEYSIKEDHERWRDSGYTYLSERFDERYDEIKDKQLKTKINMPSPENCLNN
ncbi:hypothetical protein N9P97_02070, partial [Saprospiraceae bacterium]|nr:hypothetical protein [Saprospiraceae bacterium]